MENEFNEETQVIDDAMIDDAWEDTQMSLDDDWDDESETTDEVKEEDKPIDDFETEENDSEEASETVEEPKSNAFVKVTYNGEELELSEADTITNAQKGLNYDKLKDKYDNDPDRQLIKELAELDNVSIEEFRENVRKGVRENAIQNIIDENDCSYEVAEELYESRQLAKNKEVERKNQELEKQKEEGLDAEFKDFVKEYPDVNSDDIPRSVWQDVDNGMPLLYAYQKYENAKLKNDLNIMKQNKKNESSDIGKVSKVSQKAKDDFDIAWDEAD